MINSCSFCALLGSQICCTGKRNSTTSVGPQCHSLAASASFKTNQSQVSPQNDGKWWRITMAYHCIRRRSVVIHWAHLPALGAYSGFTQNIQSMGISLQYFCRHLKRTWKKHSQRVQSQRGLTFNWFVLLNQGIYTDGGPFSKHVQCRTSFWPPHVQPEFTQKKTRKKRN